MYGLGPPLVVAPDDNCVSMFRHWSDEAFPALDLEAENLQSFASNSKKIYVS